MTTSNVKNINKKRSNTKILDHKEEAKTLNQKKKKKAMTEVRKTASFGNK